MSNKRKKSSNNIDLPVALAGGIALLGCGWLCLSIITGVGILLLFREPDCTTKRTANKKHLEKLKEQNRCRNCYLGNADLENWNLQEADLRRAKLVAANLNGANLQNANLAEAELSWHQSYNGNDLFAIPSCYVKLSAVLKKTNLSSANLSNADLEKATLTSANLESANLSEARLSGANLESANLKNANLEDVSISGANFDNADLRNANLAIDYIRSSTSFKRAKYNNLTIFPADFDPEERGMIFVP